MPYLINSECTRCGLCVPECPTDSIAAAEPKYVIDADTCADCAACVPVCPADAIQKLNIKA